jgi:hypothetical protein
VPLDLVSENGCVSLLLIVWLQISLSACSGCCLIFTGTTQPDLVLCFWTASILASRDFSTSSGAWSVFLVFFAGFFLAQVDYRCGFCAVQSLPGLGGHRSLASQLRAQSFPYQIPQSLLVLIPGWILVSLASGSAGLWCCCLFLCTRLLLTVELFSVDFGF